VQDNNSQNATHNATEHNLPGEVEAPTISSLQHPSGIPDVLAILQERLTPAHLDSPMAGSGIAPEVILACGYVSFLDQAAIAAQGFEAYLMSCARVRRAVPSIHADVRVHRGRDDGAFWWSQERSG
jgi:hypothetical protein